MLRLHLPPNFNAAVLRNAVPLRVELDLSAPPAPEWLPALALLQRWCGTPTPPKFIQLSRQQLRELAAALGSQAVFVENGAVTAWRHAALLGDGTTGGSGNSERSPASAPRDTGSTSRAPEPSPIRTPQSAIRNQGALTIDGSEHFLAITLPSREHPRYDDALALVKENGFTLDPSNRKWWLRDRHKTLNFLAAHGTELRDRFGGEFTPNFEKNAARIRPAEITTDVSPTGGGFSVSVAVRAGDAGEAELRAALASNRGYVESDGRIFLLDSRRLEKLATAQRALAGDPSAGVAPRRTLTVPPARVPEIQDLLEEVSPNFQAPDTWRERGNAVRNLTTLAPAPIPAALESLLRPYQRLGVAWLWHLFRHDLGGVLADEMGLGKTLQALALLTAVNAGTTPPGQTRKATAAGRAVRPGPDSSDPKARDAAARAVPVRAPSVVVCPASLLENWRREAVRFAPGLRVFVHHGERRLATPAAFSHHDLVITSYGTLTRDQALFTGVEFAALIADEAQHIKNRRSQNAAALRALGARSRFVLTGTPVENSLDDLRSLFEFLLPGYLTRVPAGIRGEERAWFNDRLRAQTAPYILRRTKQAVAPELPERIEQVVWCELTGRQAALYRDTQERSERELIDLEAAGASEGRLKFAALTQLLRLRQICCDPRLVPGGAADDGAAGGDATPAAAATGRPTTAPDANPTAAARREGGANPAEAPERTDDDDSAGAPTTAAAAAAFADSGKLAAFRELLEEAIDDGHRVLVFSQFTSLLALLREELAGRDLAHCYLDGSMPARARQAEVDRFQQEPAIPLFLLSLKAGGTGLNLTGADTVVHFDPWWNPAAEAQATDRAHRIGQTRTVTSYKLIASGTVEEKVLALQAEKRALLADVFEASDAASARLSLADLRGLLRRD